MCVRLRPSPSATINPFCFHSPSLSACVLCCVSLERLVGGVFNCAKKPNIISEPARARLLPAFIVVPSVRPRFGKDLEKNFRAIYCENFPCRPANTLFMLNGIYRHQVYIFLVVCYAKSSNIRFSAQRSTVYSPEIAICFTSPLPSRGKTPRL